MILCIGYSRRNCIKIQLAEPQEDIQDTDKPVLPTFDKILTLGRINKLLLLSLNRIFRGR